MLLGEALLDTKEAGDALEAFQAVMPESRFHDAALRGAGDTVFPMLACLVIAIGGMAIPAWIATELLGAGLYTAWCFVTFWVVAMGVTFYWRYRGGQWETMRVIEAVPAPQVSLQVGPLVETESNPVDRDAGDAAPPDPPNEAPIP